MFIQRLNKNFTVLDDGSNLIAHKGIYGESEYGYIKENTFESALLAIDNSISFECDIRNTADHIPVLAHENFVYSNEGIRLKVNKLKYNDLVKLLGDNAPCRLEDVLKRNNGKVPIIVDAKEAHFFYSRYRRNLSKILNDYSSKGEVVLQSFNPFFMLSMRKKLKGVLTGQLICRGKTILDSFKAPKTLAYIYERLVSFVCFIARTDIIIMENHHNEKWTKSTRFFISEKDNNIVDKNLRGLIEKIENGLYNGRKRFERFTDKIQLKLVRVTHELTKKPVIAFTIDDENDFDKMESIYIVNYIVDFSLDGTKSYIDKIKELSDNRRNQ